MDIIAYLIKIKSKFERRHCGFFRNQLIIVTIVNIFSNGVLVLVLKF